jgi:hypothetical protein
MRKELVAGSIKLFCCIAYFALGQILFVFFFELIKETSESMILLVSSLFCEMLVLGAGVGPGILLSEINYYAVLITL